MASFIVKKILVPLDGSKNSLRGLDSAIALARSCHATLTGLYVVPMSKPAKKDPISPLEKLFLSSASKFMKIAKTRSAKKGILFYDRVIYGNPGSQIEKFAKLNAYPLIVIGSRGLGSVKEIFLGSTSNYVLYKSRIPTLIVK